MRTLHLEFYWNRPLGDGGEGSVFLARSITSGRVYAAKFANALLPHLAQWSVWHELNRVLRVQGTNVVRPVAWNLGNRPFIVYDLAAYGSLRDLMNGVFNTGRVFHPRVALRRAYQMLLGVRNAHYSGVVHRDVKPDNFLVFGDDDIRLSDFGVGRTMNRPASPNSNGFMGTPGYAAPEQLNGELVDGRADIYSIGMVLYEMLMGIKPRRHGNDPLPSTRYNNILPSLDNLICRLLAWHRIYRPQTVDGAIAEVLAVWREYEAWAKWYRSLRLPNPY